MFDPTANFCHLLQFYMNGSLLVEQTFLLVHNANIWVSLFVECGAVYDKIVLHLSFHGRFSTLDDLEEATHIVILDGSSTGVDYMRLVFAHWKQRIESFHTTTQHCYETPCTVTLHGGSAWVDHQSCCCPHLLTNKCINARSSCTGRVKTVYCLNFAVVFLCLIWQLTSTC